MINATSTFLMEANNASSTLLLIMSDPVWFPIIIGLITLWVLPWKGYALWRAAKNGQPKWFIAMLILNTLALLEIFYIFVINKRNKK